MTDIALDVARYLADPATHGGAPVRRVDTHAAVVFLAGDRALKLKKPVVFPFLDFSTLDLRRQAIEREFRINRPQAPGIYRGVIALTREPDGSLALDGAGPPVEWLLDMTRFDESATLDHLCAAAPLPAPLVDALASAVAASQAAAVWREVAPWTADLAAYVEQNDQAFRAAPAVFPFEAAHRVTTAARRWLQRIDDLLIERGRLGLVRLTHGDLHAGNIALIDNRPVLFDAIEFDDAIATGDILYDVAFLIMDLDGRGQTAAANRLLGRWLVETTRTATAGASAETRADHVRSELVRQATGLAALPFFLMMRAAIRAKVTAARLANVPAGASAATVAEARCYFHLADHDLDPAEPRLLAVGGLSGTGKSTLAAALAPLIGRQPGALHLRSDVIRKLIFGVADAARLPADAYRPEVSTAVYGCLLETARAALAAGWSVVIDSVAARAHERQAFATLARALEVDFTGLWLEADPELLVSRVSARRDDASDADAAVVSTQSGYDTGEIDWIRLSASGTPEATLTLARAALGL